jgi:hypothetical protein
MKPTTADHVDEVKLRRAAVDLDLALPWSPPIAHVHRAGTRVPCLTDWQVDVLVETLAAAQRLRDPEPATRLRTRPDPTPPPRKPPVATPEERLYDALGVNADLRRRIRELEATVGAKEKDDDDREPKTERPSYQDAVLEAFEVPQLARALHVALRDLGHRDGPYAAQSSTTIAATEDLAQRTHALLVAWSQGR